MSVAASHEATSVYTHISIIMPIYIHNDRKLLFAHIPKTGGTTLNEFLTREATAALRFRGTPLGLKCPPQHLEADTLRAILPIDCFDGIFSVTRHPEDRLVSEFLSRYRKSRYKRFIESQPGRAAQASLLSLYFHKWARKSIRKCRGDPYYLDNHIRPQRDFLLQNAHLTFRIEDGIQPVIDYVKQKLQIESVPEVRHLNAAPETPKISVSISLRARIEEFFAEDYERLGYDRRS